MFVLERVDTMNDEVANRLLKTLEEPAHFVHLILLTDALGRVLETVVSRCQPVRFDPLPAARIAALLEAEGVDPAAADARARGSRSATPRGRACWRRPRAPSCGRRWTRSRAPRSTASRARAWRPLLDRAERRRAEAEEAVAAAAVERLELEPKGRERRAIERELEEAAKRDGRRARTEVLDLALTLTGLAFRDLVCLAERRPRRCSRPTAQRRWRSAPARATRAGCARRPSAARRCARRWS